jgi:hypothetical protein
MIAARRSGFLIAFGLWPRTCFTICSRPVGQVKDGRVLYARRSRADEVARKSVRPAESYAFKCTGAEASLSRFSRTRLGATSSPPPSISSRPARMSCDRVQPLHAVANLFYQMVGRGTRSRNRQTNVRHLYDYTGASRKPLTLAHFECYSVLPTRSSPNELDRGSRRLGGN